MAYLLRSTKLDTNTIKNILEKYSRKGGETIMTTAEKLEEKGIEKGIHQTAIKMIQKGLNDDVIRECTGLTQKQIDKLRKENQ